MTTRPNILLISTDHMRYDNVGANGNPHMHTPTLDRLAREGVSLENCFVQNPVCMPSRASIWTGRYCQNHRVTTNGITLPKSETTIAHALQNAGYFTANVGKLHFLPHFGKDRDHRQNEALYAGYGYEFNLLSDEPGCYPDAYMQWVERHAPQHVDACRVPLPTGARGHFDEWVFGAPEEYSHPACIAGQVRELVEAHTGTRPFFISAGFYAPHPPLNPPQRYLDMYQPDDLPLPEIHDSESQRPGYRFADITPARWQRTKAYFYAMCSTVDHYVGQMLEALESAGLADNTLIVFTSDHGDALGDHGAVGKGPSNYDSIVRVPCLLWAPGRLPAGRRVEALVESIDLFPTLCHYADTPMPVGVKGRDLAELLEGATEDGREDILIEVKDPSSGFSLKTLRSREFKYFRYHDGREVLYDLREPEPEVFDRAADPEWRQPLEAMRERLLARLIDAEDDLPERTHSY